MVRTRTRGNTIAEVVVATALAGLLMGFHTEEIGRQQYDLRTVRDESKARDGLLSAYERLRCGLLSPPAAGEKRLLDAPKGTTLTLERGRVSTALPAGVASVRLRAEWRTADGRTRRRELTTLVDGRGAR